MNSTPHEAPTLSLVLPAHRTGDDVRTCLSAVAALDPAPSEVIVVVDGADPEVVELVRPVATRVLTLAAARGPARARNAGAATATGDLLLFIDSDVLVPPDLVALVTDYLRSHAEIGALIGSYDDRPGAPNFLSQYKNLLNHYVHQNSRTEGYTFWGACGAIRRSLFESLGGFDESYQRPSVEDIELGYRIRESGQRVHVVGSVQVTHLKRWTPRSLVEADIRDRAIPWSELILRSGGFGDDLNIDRAGRVKVAATGTLVLSLLGARRAGGRLLAVSSAAALLTLDARLLRFYATKRSVPFAAATIPWLWLSYGYSGAAFAYALARRAVRRRERGPGRNGRAMIGGRPR